MIGTRRSIPGAPGLEDEYELVRELGRGGMAIVYLARELATGREVAVKLVRARYAEDGEALARFTREASVVEKLQHPCIVPVHAIRRLHDGSVALIMERVPGCTLKESIRRGGPFTAGRAEQVLRDIAGALGYAHAQGIVHRDVKPENIFIDDTTGRAFLSDFGIARPIHGGTELTLTGVAIGTPTYMSPEQIDGPTIDGRSDLYSLGLVGWEMLSGRRPWDGESLYSIIYHQKHDALPPLDAMRPDLPERLLAALEGLLEKDPAARWASAEEFLAQLSAGRPAPRRRSSPAPARSPGLPAMGQHRRIDREDIEVLLPPAPRSRRWVWYIALLLGVPAALAGGSVLLPARDIPELGRTLASVADSLVDTAVKSLPRVQRVIGAISDSVAARVGAIPATGGTARAPRSTVPARSVDGAAPRAAASPPARSRGAVHDTARAAMGRGTDACLLTAHGEAYCWGVNDHGQLGNGSLTASPVPVRVAGHRRFRALGTGASHRCALTESGEVYCWGAGGLGQLGDGDIADSDTPVAVAGSTRFSQLAVGENHSCALDGDGTAFCWGLNSAGQLGDGTAINRSTPTMVSGDLHFVAIAAGGSHSCALTAEGQAYCWGSNRYGELGDGSTTSHSTPMRVATTNSFRAISAAGARTCGTTTAGERVCWGYDVDGRRGDSTAASRPTPAGVEKPNG